jgi:hypothetical protein
VTIKRIEDVPDLLHDLEQRRFYGEVTFRFRDGQLTMIRTEQTQMLDQPGGTRSNGNHHSR